MCPFCGTQATEPRPLKHQGQLSRQDAAHIPGMSASSFDLLQAMCGCKLAYFALQEDKWLSVKRESTT